VRHFEQCLAHLNEATVCLNSLGKQFGEAKQWTPGDGLVLERINILHNRVKHFDEKLERGTFPDEMSFKLFATKPDGSGNFNYTDADISNTPFWLTNAGIESRDVSLTFAELADEVLAFYKQAEDLAVMKLD
jgi:hypothetical protein